MTTWRSTLSVVLAFLPTSCGGSGAPMGPGGVVDPNGMPREIKARPSFAVDIQGIIERRGCTTGGCHGADPGPANFTLGSDPAANYRRIVDQPSHSEPQFPLVKSFDADNSYLIIKFENRQRVGTSMPPDLFLDSIDLTNFRNWINNGAPDN